jgi:plastocyanin
VTLTLTSAGVASDANGTLSGAGLSKTGVGTYTLAAGSPGTVTAELAALVFTPTAHEVAPGQSVTTGLSFAVSNDGGPVVSATTAGIVATAVNDPATIAGVRTVAQTTSDEARLSPLATISITDPDLGATEAVTLTLTSGGIATDANGTLSGAGLSKTGVGTYTLAAGSPGTVSAELAALSFTPTAHQVVPGQSVTTGLTLAVSNDSGAAVTNTSTQIIATAVNDAPVIGGTRSGQATSDEARLAPLTAVSITDPDFGASEAVTLTLTSGGVATDANGTLSGAGLTKTGVGTYIVAAGSPSAVTAELAALVFTPTAHEVAPGQSVATGITVAVSNDGGAAVTDSTTSIVATAANDAPKISGTVSGVATSDEGRPTPLAGVSISDPDYGASEAVTLTLTSGGVATDANGSLSGAGLTKTGVGTYTLAAGSPAAVTAALAALIFTPSAHQVTPGQSVTTGLTLSVSNDGGAAVTNTATSIVATAVNDAPTISGTAGGQTTTDYLPYLPFATASIADPDAAVQDSLTIVLSGSNGAATDANGTLSGTGLTKIGVGTYVLATATPAALSSELQAVSLTPTRAEVSAGQSVTTIFTLTASQTAGGSTVTSHNATTSVVVTGLTYIYGSVYGNATIEGSTGPDVITAYAYSNTIYSNGGNDIINAGLGSATVYAAGGNDTITLAGYHDSVSGTNGNDSVTGALGNSSVTLGNGNDTIQLSGYYDTVALGNGNDSISGPLGNATVSVGNGADVISLAGTNNTVKAGSTGGTDYIDAGSGNETVTAGNGNFVILAGGTDNTIVLGNGNNFVFLSPAGNNPSLPSGTAVPVDQGASSVTTGSGNDTIELGGYGNLVNAGGGQNVIYGGEGNDVFVLAAAGQGFDTITNFTDLNGDVLDLRTALAATNWNGQANTLANYVKVTDSNGSTTLSVADKGTGGGTAIALLSGAGNLNLSDLLAHLTT